MSTKVQKSIDEVQVEEKQQPQKVTVGRIVHYWPPLEAGDPVRPWAAIVTEVIPGTDKVGVAVLDPAGITRYRRPVFYAEKPTPGSWTWPAKV